MDFGRQTAQRISQASLEQPVHNPAGCGDWLFDLQAQTGLVAVSVNHADLVLDLRQEIAAGALVRIVGNGDRALGKMQRFPTFNAIAEFAQTIKQMRPFGEQSLFQAVDFDQRRRCVVVLRGQ